MAKKPTISTLLGGYASATRLNAIFQDILTALDNTLSRDGSTPNTMEADLDLNNNDLINVKELTSKVLVIDGVRLTDANAVPTWKGAWAPSTTYSTLDIVRYEGSAYICLNSHTSGTFSIDLGQSKWALLVQKGAAGSGTGDMLAANNLSDLASVPISRANLGLTDTATTTSSAFGKSLIDDVDADTARVTLGLAAGATAEAASQVEAEAGIENTKFMTPLRTKQAINSFTSTSVELIGRQTISNSGSITFNLDNSIYDSYNIVLSNIVPVVNNVDILVRLSNNGGSSYISSSNYYFQGSVSSSSLAQSGTTTGFEINTNQFVSNQTGVGLSSDITLYGAGTTNYTQARWYSVVPVGSLNVVDSIGSGIYRGDAEVHNSVQILASSGNLLSGTVSIFGRRNS